MKTQTFVCDVHLVNKLLGWSRETQAHQCSVVTSVNPCVTKKKKKALLSVLTVCLPAVGILQHQCDCDRRHIQQADDIHTEINMSNSHCQWLGNSSKSLETFCVRAASQASQLLKIYRTIKTGGWKEPWDKFRLLLSGYICVCVKLVRASLWYYAFSGCLGIVLLPCQSYKMVQ